MPSICCLSFHRRSATRESHSTQAYGGCRAQWWRRSSLPQGFDFASGLLFLLMTACWIENSRCVSVKPTSAAPAHNSPVMDENVASPSVCCPSSAAFSVLLGAADSRAPNMGTCSPSRSVSLPEQRPLVGCVDIEQAHCGSCSSDPLKETIPVRL